MIRAKPWNGKDMKGIWEVTLKIDGVRALWDGKQWLSRAGKPLYNLPVNLRVAGISDCEVYLGNFKDTIRAVRTQTLKADTPRILPEHLYSLDPLDERLRSFNAGNAADPTVDPTAEGIRNMLGMAVYLGYEGLVLRQGDKWLKVKPEETHDVLVTGAIGGTGKHKGRLGALITAKGKVGTGFSDEERENLWRWYETGHSGDSDCPLEGQSIEVSCMHFTPDGMFRHPRFVRLRPDKVAEE